MWGYDLGCGLMVLEGMRFEKFKSIFIECELNFSFILREVIEDCCKFIVWKVGLCWLLENSIFGRLCLK